MTTGQMSDNEFIHTVAMGECWHDWSQTKQAHFPNRWCHKCDYQEYGLNTPTPPPAYDSPDSPRRLLDEAKTKTVEKFGVEKYIEQLGFVLIGKHDTTETEMPSTELARSLLTADAPTICKAICQLWEQANG